MQRPYEALVFHASWCWLGLCITRRVHLPPGALYVGVGAFALFEPTSHFALRVGHPRLMARGVHVPGGWERRRQSCDPPKATKALSLGPGLLANPRRHGSSQIMPAAAPPRRLPGRKGEGRRLSRHLQSYLQQAMTSRRQSFTQPCSRFIVAYLCYSMHSCSHDCLPSLANNGADLPSTRSPRCGASCCSPSVRPGGGLINGRCLDLTPQPHLPRLRLHSETKRHAGGRRDAAMAGL